MKKGLLSILAGALLVVGCQNYDDQFNSIENSINALKTQVDGLSAVSSQLTSLSATVQSLSTTVSSLPSSSEIATQISTGLAGIIEDVADLEAAVAAADSSDAVAAIQADIDAQEEVLADLLASSSVFTGDVVVNSAATLDAYLAMGPALSIVNGNVTITVSTAMDQTKVQSLVDNILTIVKDLTYTSAASTIAETTFDKLTGVQSITITQGGGYRFPNLLSATTIDLKDNFESTVGVIHFGSLTTVTAFETNGTANLIQFTKATELHLTSLVYYPNGTLTIETDEGAAMPFALDDIDEDGDTLEDGLTLNITGPASFSVSNIADGSITLTDVATVNLTGFYGAVTLLGDVNDFTSDSLVSLTTSSTTSLETIDVTGALDPDSTTSVGPAIALSSLSDLETAKIAGKVASITVSGNGNLTDLTITATVANAISVSSNSDLTGLTVTGATASGITVSSNSDLATLAIDLTFAAGSATGAVIDGSVVVTDNESLESLTVSSNNIETLTITGNDDLTTLDFTGVTAIGATGEATVNIYDNDLTASKITDADDGTTDVANGASGDLGSVTTTSGLDTLATYLAAVAADADSTAAVYFDSVDSFISESDSETPDAVYSASAASQADAIKVLVLSAADITSGSSSTRQKIAYKIPLASLASGGTTTLSIELGGSEILQSTSVSGLAATTGRKLDKNTDLIIDVFEETFATNRATSLGATLTAVDGASPTVNVYFYSANLVTSTFGEAGYGENYSLAATVAASNVTPTMQGVSNTTTADYITLTIGSQSVTATASYTGALGSTLENDIAAALETAWDNKWGSSGSSNTLSLIDIQSSSNSLIITSKDNGRRADDFAVSLSMTQGSTTLGTPTLAWKIGEDFLTSDNLMVGKDVIVMLEATTGGAFSSEVRAGQVTITLGGQDITLVAANTVTTSYNLTAGTNTSTLLTIYPTEGGRNGDAVNSENGTPDVTNVAAVSFSRVAWL